MSTPPSELREESRRYRRAAEHETNLHLRRKLVSHALALDYLAEKLTREEDVRTGAMREEQVD
jgi:hypothetical protein